MGKTSETIGLGSLFIPHSVENCAFFRKQEAQFSIVGIIEKGFPLQTWYLTSASISYLNQFLLALLITIYLGIRYFAPGSQPRRWQDSLLVAFFICVTIFSLLLFLEASLLPSERIIVVYLENTVLGLLLPTLIQFAYHFPVPNEKQKVERTIALIIVPHCSPFYR
jgi:hypothetical protein